MRVRLPAAAAAFALASAACRTPEPAKELEVKDLETYWAVEAPKGDTQYISPVVRFHLKNRWTQAERSIQAQAVFHRVGETEEWGSDWRQVTPAKKPLRPGEELLVELKSPGRYYSTGEPHTMFQHELFKDASVEVFVRVGSSPWTKMAVGPVDRRIGSRSVETTSP
jgi:hypothetical protein